MNNIIWLDISELTDEDIEKDIPILVFSPCYENNVNMRYRIIQPKFVRFMTEITKFARLND